METIAERDLEFLEVLYKTDVVEVWKAILKTTNDLVAVKKLKANSVEDATFYTAEALSMAKLSHSNIVQLRGCFMSGRGKQIEYVLFVMKFYEKGDLQSEIERRQKLRLKWDENELWNHMRTLIEVFSFLQRKDVAHRDIKPQNIFIGDNNELLVADLGCVVLKQNAETLTLAGTPLFLSPLLRRAFESQNAGGVKHNAFKSDVYSLGITFYYMASLADIFEFANLIQLQPRLTNRINERVHYSDRIKNILQDMLAVDENARLDFIELWNKYFLSSTFVKIPPAKSPNLSRYRKIGTYKVSNCVTLYNNERVIYKVKIKKEQSKTTLESIFRSSYWKWERINEYIYILLCSGIKLNIYKLQYVCLFCNYPIDDPNMKIAFHDGCVHNNCSKFPNISAHYNPVSTDNKIWEEQCGFDCNHNNKHHFHPLSRREINGISCPKCRRYFLTIQQNNCGHLICDECLRIPDCAPWLDEDQKTLICPSCPKWWTPKAVFFHTKSLTQN